MRESELKVLLYEGLVDFQEKLDRLTQAIHLEEDLDLPLHVQREAPDNTLEPVSREEAVRFYSQIEYEDEQAKNETRKMYGYIGVTTSIVPLIEEINTSKASLSKLFGEMKKYRVALGDEASDGSRSLLKRALELSGRARLQKQQTTRTIQVAPYTTNRLAFFYANIRRVKKISLDDARNRLANRAVDNQHHATMELLDTMHDTVLAEVSQLPVHVRVNIGYLNAGKLERTQRTACVPVLVPMSPGQKAPLLSQLRKDVVDRQCLPRPNRKLEDEPLFMLSSTEYYRYLPACA